MLILGIVYGAKVGLKLRLFNQNISFKSRLERMYLIVFIIPTHRHIIMPMIIPVCLYCHASPKNRALIYLMFHCTGDGFDWSYAKVF